MGCCLSRRGGEPLNISSGEKNQDFSFRKVSLEGLNKVAGPTAVPGEAAPRAYITAQSHNKTMQEEVPRLHRTYCDYLTRTLLFTDFKLPEFGNK